MARDAPGQPQMGKTTLARHLEQLLNVPRLSQDYCGGKGTVFVQRLQALLRTRGVVIADR